MKTLNVIIETPKGSDKKYDYDFEKRGFVLKKLLPAGLVFPYDFGFIPDTKGEDGDPLDVVSIAEFNTFPGCIIECRLIGCIVGKQDSEKGMIRNDRYLVVPQLSLVYKEVMTARDLPKKLLEELEEFFVEYNKQQGKKYRVEEMLGSHEAIRLLHKS